MAIAKNFQGVSSSDLAGLGIELKITGSQALKEVVTANGPDFTSAASNLIRTAKGEAATISGGETTLARTGASTTPTVAQPSTGAVVGAP